MKRGLFFIIFLLSIESLAAQWRAPRLHHFGPDEGLTSGVRDMDQDAQGYMYFGTDQGLYRYDGSSFEFFGHDTSDTTSISPGFIKDVLVSRNQKIYLIIYGVYLNIFDPSTRNFTKYKLPAKSQFDTQFANSATEDDEGNIWIGGDNYQLFKFDPIKKEFSTYSVSHINDFDKNGQFPITKVFNDTKDKNILWLTVHSEKPLDINFSSYGLVQFNIETERFTRINGAGKIRLQDNAGHLWGSLWGDFITEMDPIQNSTQIHSYKSFYEKQFKAKPSDIGVSKDIVQYQNGLFIACDDILSLDQKDKFEYFYDYKDGSDANNLFVDKMNNLWIGKSDGADVYSPQNDQIFFYSLSTFGEDKRIYPGRLAYNSANKSFYLIGSTSNNYKQIYKIPHPKYYTSKPITINVPQLPIAILQNSDNTLTFTGQGKMFELNALTNKVTENINFTKSEGNLPFLYKLISNDQDWIVGFGYDKIIWWRKNDKTRNEIHNKDLKGSMENDFFTNLQFYGQNKLAVTTRSDVFSIDLLTKQHQKFKVHTSDSISYITGLEIDSTENIWISTLSNLTQFSKEGLNLRQEKTYALKEGIRSPTIQEIFIDQHGKVWIFHQSGMDCLNPKTDEIRNIGSIEGLPHTTMDPIQIAETDDGYLATNCGNGLIVWHPDSLWKSLDPQIVPLIIESIQVNGKNWKSSSNLPGRLEFKLPKGPKVVSVNYQGFAYPTDKNVRYCYRFANQDSNWISIGTSNQLILSDLPYGDNYLEIKSGNPKVVAPIVKAYIYNPTPLLASPYFYCLLIGIVLFGMYLLYKWRVKELKKKEEQKTFYNKKMAELELTALRSQMNPHFMFNSLNSIKTYILEAKPDIAADYLSQFSHLIRRILQNSREKRISLEEEIETLKLYIQLEQFRFEHAFEFKIDIDPTIELSEIMIPPMLLQPFIENAIWHGLMHMDDKGRLNLEFIQNSGYISCVIDDNGIGREKAKELKSLSARKYKSMGMNITQNRVQLLNTIDSLGITLDIVDKYDLENMPTGTKVILKIPISIDE